MSTLDQELNDARRRVLNGETLSIEEQQRLVAAIRGQRRSAAETGNAARTKKTATRQAKEGISDSDLDAQLGDLGL